MKSHSLEWYWRIEFFYPNVIIADIKMFKSHVIPHVMTHLILYLILLFFPNVIPLTISDPTRDHRSHSWSQIPLVILRVIIFVIPLLILYSDPNPTRAPISTPMRFHPWSYLILLLIPHINIIVNPLVIPIGILLPNPLLILLMISLVISLLVEQMIPQIMLRVQQAQWTCNPTDTTGTMGTTGTDIHITLNLIGTNCLIQSI